MGDIFVSHSSADVVEAMTVAEALRQAGHSVSLDDDDEDGIVPGSERSRTIFHKLRLCDGVVFLSSAASNTLKWPYVELAVAADLGKRCYWLDLAAGLETEPHVNQLHGIRFGNSLTDSIEVLIDALRSDGLSDLEVARWDERRAPYPGLAAMDAEDAGVFFGRDGDVLRLTERVSGPLGQIGGDLVVVVGPSGAGKSSLVRAGLSARLAGPTSGWAVARAFEPGPRPLDRLVNRLVVLGHDQVSEADCRDRLWRYGLGSTAQWLIEHHRPPAKRLLVVVDQAEQLATVPQRADSEEFLEVLAGGLGTGSPVTIVMTARSDRFDEVQRLPGIGAAIQESFVVAPMDRSQLAAVIEGPARRADLGFDPGLVGDLIDDAMRGRTGEAVDSLPLLAFTLREMYNLAVRDGRRTITVADYDHVGRIEGAIARRAAAAESSLPPASRPVLERLLPRFVTLSEERLPAGRPVARQQLSAAEEAVVQALEDQRLLTGTNETVRLAHERLIVAWPALAQAVAEQREDLVLQARLERQAADWKEGAGGLLDRDATKTATQWLTQRADPAVAQGPVGQYVRSSKAGLSRRRARASVLGLIVVLALVAAGIAGVAVHENSNLSSEERLAASGEVAAEATNVMPNNLAVGMLLSLESLRLAANATSRAAVMSAVNQPIDGILAGDGSVVNSVAFSPDGKVLATSDGNGNVWLWDVASHRQVGPPLDDGNPVNSVAFSPDGRILAAGDDRGHVLLWDVASHRQVGPPLDDGNPVNSVAFSPDDNVLAAGDEHGDVHLWALHSATGVDPVLITGNSAISGVAFSPDGRTLVAGRDNGSVLQWDVASHRQIGPPIRDESSITSLAFSPDGRTFATGDDEGEVTLWDLATGDQAGPRLSYAGGAIDSIAFSPDGKRIATGDDEGDVVLWDLAIHKQAGSPLNDGRDAVTSVAFSPDGKTVATGDDDGEVVLWSVGSREFGPALGSGSGQPVFGVAFSPDGKIIASAGPNGVMLWDSATGAKLASLSDGRGVTSLAFSPRGTTLATGDNGGDVVLWDIATHREVGSLAHVRNGAVTSVGFSPNGKILASGDAGGEVALWNASTDSQLGAPLRNESSVNSLGFSPDGKSLVAGLDNGEIELWDVVSRQPASLPFDVGGGAVTSVVFSPNGKILASGDAGGEVALWNASTGNELGSPLSVGNAVNTVVFSPDGNVIASGDAGGDVFLWDVATGAEFASPLSLASAIKSVAFSPNGSTLAAGDGEGDVVFVPSLYLGRDVATMGRVLCTEVGGNLTRAEWGLYIPDERYQTICPGYP